MDNPTINHQPSTINNTIQVHLGVDEDAAGGGFFVLGGAGESYDYIMHSYICAYVHIIHKLIKNAHCTHDAANPPRRRPLLPDREVTKLRKALTEHGTVAYNPKCVCFAVCLFCRVVCSRCCGIHAFAVFCFCRLCSRCPYNHKCVCFAVFSVVLFVGVVSMTGRACPAGPVSHFTYALLYI